jgi:hypothetical protein
MRLGTRHIKYTAGQKAANAQGGTLGFGECQPLVLHGITQNIDACPLHCSRWILNATLRRRAKLFSAAAKWRRLLLQQVDGVAHAMLLERLSTHEKRVDALRAV